MKVILKSDLKAIGKAGEVIQVKKGFARNYLFPKNLAIEASPKSIKHQKHLNHIVALKKEEALNKRQKLLEEISNINVTFHRAVSEKNRLFASVTATDILGELNKKNFSLDKKEIFLKSPIKTIGEHVVLLKIAEKKEKALKVIVLPLEKELKSQKKVSQKTSQAQVSERSIEGEKKIESTGSQATESQGKTSIKGETAEDKIIDEKKNQKD